MSRHLDVRARVRVALVLVAACVASALLAWQPAPAAADTVPGQAPGDTIITPTDYDASYSRPGVFQNARPIPPLCTPGTAPTATSGYECRSISYSDVMTIKTTSTGAGAAKIDLVPKSDHATNVTFTSVGITGDAGTFATRSYPDFYGYEWQPDISDYDTIRNQHTLKFCTVGQDCQLTLPWPSRTAGGSAIQWVVLQYDTNSTQDPITNLYIPILPPPSTSVPEPVVNSTGDANATDNGTKGCTTGSTVIVNGTSKPECTLRAAIQAENAKSVTSKSITFALPTTGVIAPTSPLPALTADGVTIDGTTGPGGMITIDGTASGSSAANIALHVSGGQDVVQGFAFHYATTAILVDAKSGHDVVRANLIGVDANGSNSQVDNGIDVENSPSATIGGPADADRNVIGDVGLGVKISGTAAAHALVAGNYLGTDTQHHAIPVGEGVGVVDASGVVVGGTATQPGHAPGNVIVGTSSGGGVGADTGTAGVIVAGSTALVTGTVVQGNLIGLQPDGTTLPQAQLSEGILVGGRMSGTLIGGTQPGQGNVVSNAKSSQITVTGTLTGGTQIYGNLVGTDASGLATRSGGGTPTGIEVAAATTTTIGSPGTGRNVIAGQAAGGVVTTQTSTPLQVYTAIAPGTNKVTSTATMSTIVSGNIVGPGADGTTVDAERIQRVGVSIGGLGDQVGPNNQVSFNEYGVVTHNANEQVFGNLIGTDPNGTAALPNGTGVEVTAGAGISTVKNGVQTVQIGVPGQKANTISGNVDNLIISGGAASRVQNNRVGTRSDGLAVITPYPSAMPDSIRRGGELTGALVYSLASGSLIGGNRPGFGNVIAGAPAGSGGIVVDAPAVVQGNQIGVGADGFAKLGNATFGVGVSGAGSVIGAPAPGGTGTTTAPGGNIIANNGTAGVLIDAKTYAVVILSNQVHDNGGPAIAVTDATSNNGAVAPVITAAVQDAHNAGTSSDSTVVFVSAAPGAIVQLYAGADCGEATSAGQGDHVLATDIADASGNLTLTIPIQAVGTTLDATATGSDGTSGFSACVPVTAPAAGGVAQQATTSPGRSETVRGTGFTADEAVDGSIHSTPITLGTKHAAADGSVSFTFTVPASLTAGVHYLLLKGTDHAVAIPVAVRTVSSAPRAPRATPGKATTALSWTAPASTGGAAVTAYQVLRSTDRRHWTVRASAVQARTFTDTKLAGGVRYYYEIRAVNAVGASVASAVVSAVPFTAPSAPRSPHAKAGARSIALSWSAPAAAHGARVTRYVVQYAACRVGTHGCHAHAVTVTRRKLTIKKLVAGRRYYLSVTAINRAGRGLPSTRVSARPKH